MKSHAIAIRNLAILAGLLFLAYVFIKQSKSLEGIFSVLGNVQIDRLFLGALMFALTYVLSSLNYSILAKKQLRIGQLFALQVASGFANKLMPAGLGSMTLNARFLLRHGHNTAQAVAVASTNNLIGIVGHLILLAFAMPGLTNGPLPLAISGNINIRQILLVIIVLVVAVSVIYKRWGKKLARLANQSLKHIRAYQKRPGILLGVFVLSLCISGAYVVILQACVQAVDAHILPSEALLAISAGLVGTSIMPTPGGAGGAEAGIALVLSGFGLPATLAISSALLYRLMTFWLPLIPGFVVFEWLQLKRQLF